MPKVVQYVQPFQYNADVTDGRGIHDSVTAVSRHKTVTRGQQVTLSRLCSSSRETRGGCVAL